MQVFGSVASTLLVVLLCAGCSSAPEPSPSAEAPQGSPDAGAASPSPTPAALSSADVRFARDVVPVLIQNCTECHRSTLRGDYRTAETAWPALTGPSRALPSGFGCAGNKPRGLVVPGSPEASALWQLVGLGFDGKTGTCPGKVGMPKNDPRGILADFDPAGAETIRRWIEQGARND